MAGPRFGLGGLNDEACDGMVGGDAAFSGTVSAKRARLTAQAPRPFAVSSVRGHEPKTFSSQPGFAAFHSLALLAALVQAIDPT